MMDLNTRAKYHRSLFHNTAFIGITGSCGKTTTKNLALYLLQPDLQGICSSDDGNCGTKLANNVLGVRLEDDFCLQELGAWGPGTLDAGLELVQPDIGIVLNIRNDHYSSFKGLQNTQAEKSKVIRLLPSTGTAILNADDPYVWEMRQWTSASVLSFGKHPDATLRAERVHSAWPDRLSFDLSYCNKKYHVNTLLISEHLIGSALAALAIAVVMGIPITTAIARLSEAQPTERRMSTITLQSGLTFIRDDFKATFDSMPEVVKFLKQVRVNRKIAVLGRISDHPGRSRRVYTTFAKAVAEVVDELILVGERPEDLWGRIRRNSPDFLAEFDSSKATVSLFETVLDASLYLHKELRKDDFVFLKGSGVSDHLERILLQFQTDVQCWKTRCGLIIACDSCDMLSKVVKPG